MIWIDNYYRTELDDYRDTTMLLDDGDDDDDDVRSTVIPPHDTKRFNDGVIMRTVTELICQPTFMYDGQTVEHCYNDRYCKLYGDCCRNSKYYVDYEQTVTVGGGVYNNSRYGCYGSDGMKSVSLMIGKCPRTTAIWHRGIVEKCEKNVVGGGGGGENDDDDADFLTSYPVTAADTGHAYKNAYCAWCHGERQNVVYWKPLFQCKDRGGRLAASVHLEDASDRTLLYRNGRWYYADYDNHALLTCDFALQPPGAVSPLRPCVKGDDGLTDGCPTGTPVALANACASYTYTIFEHVVDGGDNIGRRLARAFRNVDCARCNNVTVDRLSCTPPPPLLQFGFHSLFAVRSANRRRGPCAPDELYDVLASKCRNVIRDELPDSCSTYATFGPSEYNHRSMDNNTVYVYAYKTRARYRNHGELLVNRTLDVCIEDEPKEQPHRTAYLSYLSYAGVAGSFVSTASLAAHLALFGTSAEPKNLPEKNLASLSVGLLLGHAGHLAVVLGVVAPGPGIPCIAAALVIQYGFLSAFAWMFVMSADVWIVLHASAKKLRVAGGKRNVRFAVYSAFAWISPASMVGLAAALQLNPWSLSAVATFSGLRPNFQYDCWFRNPQSLVALFVIPAGATIVANYVSFIGAVRLIATSGDVSGGTADSAVTIDRTRRNLKIYVRLSLMMGLAWAFGLAGAIADNDVVWTLYTALNSLQGAFIFIAFDCNNKIVRSLAAFRKPSSGQSETQNTAVTPLSAST